MNRLALVALLLAATTAHAKDFTKGAVAQAAPNERGASAPEGTFQQTEQLQRQFPEGTRCSFDLTREQLQAMKPGQFYVPAGNVIWCRQPFDSKRKDRSLHT